MKKNVLSLTADLSAESKRALAIYIAVISSLVAFSQEKLIKDLERGEYPFYNEYSDLVEMNGTMYFISQGKELWKSNGTSETTVRIKVAKSMSDLTVAGTTLYFVGEDGGGKELWKSDGTAAGSLRVKDIRPGAMGSNPHDLAIVKGEVYFVADNGTAGNEVWKSNGTAGGTILLRDIYAGPQGSDPKYLIDSNDGLMFAANDGKTGRDLWISNGTSAGTVKVLEGAGRDFNSDPMNLTSDLNGTVFFTAWQSTTGRELWKSNGTAAGTVRVKDIKKGNASASINNVVAAGTHIYFNADDGVNGQALWRTDGTPSGTVMVKDLSQYDGVPAGGIIAMKSWVNNPYFYFITEDQGYYAIYKSDGTTAGTVLLLNSDQYLQPAFTYLNGFVYFYTYSFSDDTYNFALTLYKTNNGSGAGVTEVFEYTVPISYEENEQYDFNPELLSYNNSIIFPGILNASEGFKLLTSNGTPGNASILYDTYKPTKSSVPDGFVKANGYVFFTTTQNYGWDILLWRTDGTPQGTIMLKKFELTLNMVASGNEVFITTSGDFGKWQLWKSNGTASGTVLVKEFTNQTGDTPESMISTSDGSVYINTELGELWKSNGAANGTVMMKDFYDIGQIAASGNRAFIIASTADGSQELWKSNGTVAGTVKVKTIRAGSGNLVRMYFSHAANDQFFYFIADDGVHGFELWRTDGTNTGTYMVRDFVQADEAQNYSDLGPMSLVGDTLYLAAASANWAGAPRDLYVTDGTNAGTSLVSAHKNVYRFMPYGDKMIFVHQPDDDLPAELWVSDGTSEGTTHIRTLTQPSYFLSSTRIDNFIYFANYANDIWRTDGTICGTTEITFGVTEVSPISNVGTQLVFGAHHPFYGKELFGYQTSQLSSDPCGTHLAARASGVDETIMTTPEEEFITSAPNPFTNNFGLQINSTSGFPAHVDIYAMTGVPVEQLDIATNVTHTIGERWTRGLYIMKVTVEGKTSMHKIIKE